MDLDDPETTVTGDIAQISSLAVDRSDDNTLARMAFDDLAIRRTVLVIRGGKERLHLFDVSLLHSGQLADLHDPKALQLFCAGLVVHVSERQRF